VTLAQLIPAWKLYQHVPVMVFIFAFGAIVGSFINVVIYRLPQGMSVITPSSRCPTCGARLSWWENTPILGWLFVRGRCRHCGVTISPQYMLVELFMALLFAGLYLAFYVVGPVIQGPGPAYAPGWWDEVGGNWWFYNHVSRTFPAFIALLFMLAGLVAMTMIDARTFEIPIKIPLVLTLIAFVAWPVQALLPANPRAQGLWAIQTTNWQWFAVACGGMLGILVSLWLLRRGVLRYSFADYEQYVEQGETFADYPHARREMMVEMLYLAPCIAGLVAGYVFGAKIGGGPPPVIVQAVGGSLLGYLAGGGLVWAVRILGTLGFGREAMGLGDVHLMGAVGAVLGWVDPIFIFLLAPFFGLMWAVLSMGFSSLLHKKRRELPYGPHLAVATLVVILCRPAVSWVQVTYLPGVPPPGLVQPAPPTGPSGAPRP
jgi:leader peptidase (prepilin peptidase)/N-methyltransferase